jgi:parvulin-like peptidyl-prolyl isomerase
VFGVFVSEAKARLAILACAALLLLGVVGYYGYQKFDEHFLVPNHVVLTVGDEDFKLSYYADRLYGFVQADSSANQGNTNLPLDEQLLLSKLEDEALTIQLAKDKGIDLNDDAITQEIASELGVPVGGPGSSFDTLYRGQLKTAKMSDGSYRRQAEASLANSKLLELYQKDLGDTAEGVTIRVVESASKDDADKALQRIQSGEDMGSVAQAVSTDLQSQQNDGFMLPEPPELLPDAVQQAIKDKPAGDDLIGPVQVDTNWWVFRIDKRDPAYQLSDTQKQQLAQVHLTNAIKDQGTKTTIKRSLSTSDINWAVANAG